MVDLQAVNACVEALLNHTSNLSDETLLNNLKFLRNSLANGESIQNFLASHDAFQMRLGQWLFDSKLEDNDFNRRMQLMAWQILANTIVNNASAMLSIWNRHGEQILAKCCEPPHSLGRHTDIKLMIIYNIFKSDAGIISDQKALRAIVQVWQSVLSEKYKENLDFLHFLYEYFIVEGGRRTVACLVHLDPEERIAFLDYLASYIRHDSPNGLVHTFLLQYISKEFKKKSDCVLRQLTQNVNEWHPREVHALLRILASASGSENYENIFSIDHALFLNVSSLLRCLVGAGKESSSNIFTPMNKLEEVAPSSTEVSRDFETEVSFEMKTLLVRCVANLLYKNSVNQGYCLDTQVMPALFECTNMDARNPLMKEWSILAIRNACVGCPEIQEVVANLTKKGVVKNDIVEELNLEMGSLRIQPNKD